VHADTPNTSYRTDDISWFRGIIRGRTRIALAWLYVILLIWFAREYPTWPGIALCFAGASIRYWASGYLRKDTRPAVGGPYAWVRNPLYLGTYLMALGTAWAIEAWWLLGSSTVIFALIYHFIILDEETKLRTIFGAPYLRWCELVPRFFPRPWPASRNALLEVNPEAAYHRFSHELAHRNKAYESYVSFVGLIGFVAAVAFLWKTLG
jgi:protein-S-isoprenylcysteine O-methyltransferase Ste14